MDTVLGPANFIPNSDRWTALEGTALVRFRRDNGDVYLGFQLADGTLIPHHREEDGPERQARREAASAELKAQQEEAAHLQKLRERHLRYKADPAGNASDRLTSEELADLVVSLLG